MLTADWNEKKEKLLLTFFMGDVFKVALISPIDCNANEFLGRCVWFLYELMIDGRRLCV